MVTQRLKRRVDFRPAYLALSHRVKYGLFVAVPQGLAAQNERRRA